MNAAGTLSCPTCCGQAVIYRHTPDLMKVFKLQPPWIQLVGYTSEAVPESWRQDKYIEYPAGPPPPMPKIEKPLPKIRGLEGRSLDEVILPFVDDSDSDEDS